MTQEYEIGILSWVFVPGYDVSDPETGETSVVESRYASAVVAKPRSGVGDWVSAQMSISLSDLERNSKPEQLESLIRTQIEIASLCVEDLLSHDD